MNEAAVSIRGLVKKYGGIAAVGGVDLEVGRGEVFGILGPNGAGKTTTLECLEGLRRPDAGTLRVAGCDPLTQRRRLRRVLGVQLQSSSLPGSIRVGEAFRLISAWQGIEGLPDLTERFQIGSLMKKQYQQLSTGQKRRVHLALALLSDPEVLILDEPTAGLDVQNRAQLHEEIRLIRERGITVLLATHDMAEAETLCDRIAILAKGKIRACGTPEQITADGERGTRIRLRTSKGSLSPGTRIGGADFVQSKGGYLEWVSSDAAPPVIELLGRIRENGDEVEDLRVERPTLEERFLELVEGVQ